ncbi:MAG: site-specific DNA-methyltransferase [bacterium]
MATKPQQIKKKELEQYEHKGKERINNPPVGLVTPETDKDSGKKGYAYDPHLDPQLQFDSRRDEIELIIDNGIAAQSIEDTKAALLELKKRQQPYLNWAGKAEHTSFEVPTVSLHVHERIDPQTIIKAVKKKNGTGKPLSLFELYNNQPLREAVEFYKHKHDWSNRLIAGDSLLVMNSLLEKEGMSGKVQMIYIDPPYGIKYGSNFQPFVNKRDVKDGRDEDLTAEPEMIKAFRDTWELGIHSYLTYMRDRLLLARELLTESGSVFVQISDENVHHVRELMDEVFGVGNFISQIYFATTSGFATSTLSRVGDYLIWYAKDRGQLKYRQLFFEKNNMRTVDEAYKYLELQDGIRRPMSREEREGLIAIPSGSRIYRIGDLQSQGAASNDTAFEFEGETFRPKPSSHWKANYPDGMERLRKANRIEFAGNNLNYVRFIDDYPVMPVNNSWMDTGFAGFATDKRYVVETNTKVITRCLLMTTDPGDLVLDPTCGSGTTAYVAEQWGRRWITCDTSRVALTLAKQRLMTALYDYYELLHPEDGVGSGFKYKTVPHITLKSIDNNEPPGQETLYDQPYMDNKKARVTGPFTVEAVPSPTSKSLDELAEDNASDVSISRSGETLRQSEWRDELLNNGVRGKGGQYIKFSRVEPMSGTKYIQAEAETKPENDTDRQRVLIVFGPEYAPMEQCQVELALDEAQLFRPKADIILFAAFQFDPEAAKDIDETNWPGVMLLRVQMNADLFTDDLKKKRTSNDSFWLLGQPDVQLKKIEEGEHKDKFQVEVRGFDYYDTKTGNVISGSDRNIAMWMLDSDYNGRSLFPRQIFFPMSSDTEGWGRLAKNLKAEIDQELIEAYRGTVSLPFSAGEYKQCAVKIVDDRGIESLRIIRLGE